MLQNRRYYLFTFWGFHTSGGKRGARVIQDGRCATSASPSASLARLKTQKITPILPAFSDASP